MKQLDTHNLYMDRHFAGAHIVKSASLSVSLSRFLSCGKKSVRIKKEEEMTNKLPKVPIVIQTFEVIAKNADGGVTVLLW
jgi:hypothetical protein